MTIKTIGIAGLGLMGGAVAMALRHAFADIRLLACDIDENALTAAETDAVIDEGFVDAKTMLPQCEMVFLCLNPSITLQFMAENMRVFAPKTLITDITGVKTAVVSFIEANLRADVDYVPGHPMAGSEKGGYFEARNCGFTGKNYILTPLKRNKPENLALMREIVRKMGFSRITETTPAEHDYAIAFTSQLCHVIAAALINCESDSGIIRFGGGSFEDLTRIALFNATQWTELFLENRKPLLARIAQFEASLDKIKDLIRNGDHSGLQIYLQTVRKRKEEQTALKTDDS
ncbi:MAG: prephenate dehydrogenase [Treponema sp.]|jgi:prephenate dehydrogenase|nr:prephenate dehydrogenase [Treponema sp.]